MTAFIPDEKAPLLIEITPTPGVQEVALSSEELAARADEVMQTVMNAIHGVSERFSDLYAYLLDQFTQVELSFGVKISSEMGALIAKSRHHTLGGDLWHIVGTLQLEITQRQIFGLRDCAGQVRLNPISSGVVF